MNTTFFIIMLLLYLLSRYKDFTTTYYDDPYDIDDISPWFKCQVFSGTFAMISFIVLIISFSIVYLSDKIFFSPEIITIAKYLLYFGK